MTRAAQEQSPEPNSDAAAEDPSEDQGRASGSRPATRYEPLPIGSDAFATPLAPSTTVSDAPGALRARAVWLIVGAAAGVALGALGLALVLKPGHAAQTPGQAQVEQASKPAIAPIQSEPSLAHPSNEPQQAPAAAPASIAPKPAAAEPQVAAAPAAAELQVAAAAEPTRAPSSADDAVRQAERTPTHTTSSERAHARPRSHRLPEQPDRAQVIAAMATVQPAVQACFGAARGTATADVRILGSSGRVTTARVTGQPGGIGSCIARAVRQARFPKFATESLTISYPFGH